MTVHPAPNEDTPKRPDFLAEHDEYGPFYVEARVASNESEEDAKAEARKVEVYDALDRTLESPNFCIGLELYGAPRTPPSAKSIKAFLEARLADLDPDAVAELFKTGDEPRWHYEHDAWDVVFYPIPKGPKNRGKPGIHVLGVFASGGPTPLIDTKTAIKKAVQKKAGRYGKLDLPYVIAVNALDTFTDRIDVLDALFGTEVFVDRRYEDGRIERKPERKPDGALVGAIGPQNTRVSAVLLCEQVFPWSVASASVCLYHHCFAALPYDGVLTQLPQMRPDGNQVRFLDGNSLAQVFGLPAEFPSTRPQPRIP